MLAIKLEEYNKFGCLNCGCDAVKSDNFNENGVFGVTCLHCNLHFAVFSDTLTSINCKVVYMTGRTDENGNKIREKPILISHPRKGMKHWNYVAEDAKPDSMEGEYWKSKGVGFDLSGLIKSKEAGLRILNMVKLATNKDYPKSWMDYRDTAPNYIQFKFSADEFDLDMIHKMSIDLGGVVTQELLNYCCICREKSEKGYSVPEE